MKTKYFFVYVFVGVAFLAVSAWVFLSGGKNAKAVRTKYKLGGIMLTAWAMLSVSSCRFIPGTVTCYEPMMPEQTDNFISVSIKSKDSNYQPNQISPGDVFQVSISVPSYSKYVLRVILNNTEGTELQREVLEAPANENAFTVPLSDKVTYKGEAIVQIQGIQTENPETLSQTAYGIMVINIL